MLCIYSDVEINDVDFLLTLRKLFTKVYLNGRLPSPNISAKIFSVLMVIGESHDNLYNDVKSSNSFYGVIKFKTKPSINVFINELTSNVPVYKMIETSERSNVNVAVFDMDDTIITPEYELFYKNILNEIDCYREYFQYIVLWTHGTEDYLYKRMMDINYNFDLLIARKREIDDAPKENKGLAVILRELNKKFQVQSLGYTLLVDDRMTNYKNDYDSFLFIDRLPTKNFYLLALDRIRKNIMRNKREIIVASTIHH